MIKPLNLRWGSKGPYILTIIISTVVVSVLWLGVDFVLNRDAKSYNKYYANINSLTSSQTDKPFTKITAEPDSVDKAKAEFKSVTKKIESLSVPSSLEKLHNKYVTLYRNFSEDDYWALSKEYLEIQIEYQQAIENSDKLYDTTLKYKLVTDESVAATKKWQTAEKNVRKIDTRLVELDQELKVRLNLFSEQLGKLSIELSDAP